MKRTKPFISSNDIDSVVEYMGCANTFGDGQAVKELEDALQDLTHYKHAIVVSSGSVALDLSVTAHNVTRSVSVEKIKAFVPKNTYVASARCFIKNGITPETYIDDSEDYDRIYMKSMDDYTIGLAMHYGGHRKTPMEIFGMCKFVIEDSAHALSTDIGRVKHKGTDIVTLSFNTTKNVTGDMGGCILTDCDKLAEVCRNLRHYDMNKTPIPSYVMHHGGNYKLGGLNATLVRSQIRQLNARENMYKELRHDYTKALGDLTTCIDMSGSPLEGAYICEASEKATFPHIINLMLGKVVEVTPLVLINKLRESGIYTNIYYPDIDDLLNYSSSVSKITDKITLPMDPYLSEAGILDVYRIISETINEINKTNNNKS